MEWDGFERTAAVITSYSGLGGLYLSLVAMVEIGVSIMLRDGMNRRGPIGRAMLRDGVEGRWRVVEVDPQGPHGSDVRTVAFPLCYVLQYCMADASVHIFG